MLVVKTKLLRDVISKSINGKGLYEDVLLKAIAGGNVLELITVDNDCCLSQFINANSSSDLLVSVNKKTFSNVLKSIKDEVITLLLQEDKDNMVDYLIIKTEKANYRLKASSNRIFEAFNFSDFITEGKISLDGKVLVKVIDNVIYALSKEKIEHEPYKSVGLIFEKEKLYISGTNGHRLAVCSMSVSNTDIEGRYGIPKASIMHLKKLLKVNVLFDIIEVKYHKVAVFKGEGFIFYTFLIDSIYPDIFGVINGYKDKLVIELKLSKDVMIDILKAFVVEKKDYYPIKLILKDGILNIQSPDGNVVNAVIDYKGNEYVISVDAIYMLEAINNICSDEIVIKLPISNNYPIYVEPNGDCSCLALIMPRVD